MKQEKIWGVTELITSNNTLELHKIDFEAGYCCSEHYHKTKYNGFYVLEGYLEIRIWREESDRHDAPNTYRLEAGEFIEVAPNRWHQFVGLESGSALELYWSGFDAKDIVRRTQGKRVS